MGEDLRFMYPVNLVKGYARRDVVPQDKFIREPVRQTLDYYYNVP